LVGRLGNFVNNLAIRYRAEVTCRRHCFEDVRLGDVAVQGNVKIGKGTYINSGKILAGRNSRVIIGENCNIGYNVWISAITHPREVPTDVNLPREEADIIIGNRVWIGINVVIREGVTIGDDAVIGANSVVTHNVEKQQAVGGVPARPLKRK
jgi:maltose O-acetyltransferase